MLHKTLGKNKEIMNKSSVALLILLLLVIDQKGIIWVFAYIFWRMPAWPGALNLAKVIWPNLF